MSVIFLLPHAAMPCQSSHICTCHAAARHCLLDYRGAAFHGHAAEDSFVCLLKNAWQQALNGHIRGFVAYVQARCFYSHAKHAYRQQCHAFRCPVHFPFFFFWMRLFACHMAHT